MNNGEILSYIALKLNEQDNQGFHEPQVVRIFNEMYIDYLTDRYRVFERQEQFSAVTHPLVRYKDFENTTEVAKSQIPKPLRILGVLANFDFAFCGEVATYTRFVSPMVIDQMGPERDSPFKRASDAWPRYTLINKGGEDVIRIESDNAPFECRVYYLATPIPMTKVPTETIELTDDDAVYEIINKTIKEIAAISENQIRYQASDNNIDQI